MHGEQFLGPRRRAISPATDDHVRFPVGEVQEPVLVQVTDVAQGCPAASLRIAGGSGLGRVAGVLERGSAREVPRPDPPYHYFATHPITHTRTPTQSPSAST